MSQFNGDVARRLAVGIDLVNVAALDGLAADGGAAFEAHGFQAPTTGRDWADLTRMTREHATFFDMLLADGDAVVQLLNDRLQRLDVTPQLERRGNSYQLHFHTTAAGFAHGWDAGITAALAISLSTGDARRIGRCEAAHCRQLYLDRGRNARRRFCGLQCQNRAKSAAYRARNIKR